MEELAPFSTAKIETCQRPSRVKEVINLGGYQQLMLSGREIRVAFVCETGIYPVSRVVMREIGRWVPESGYEQHRQTNRGK
jgi:hypothetical protein